MTRRRGPRPACPGGSPPGPPSGAPEAHFRARKWASIRRENRPSDRSRAAAERSSQARARASRARGERTPERTLWISIRVSAAELAAIEARARAAGIDRSSYLRRAALGHPIVALRVPAIHLQAIGQLQRLGNNLNQAVRLVHEGRLSPDLGIAVEAVRRLLVELRRELRGESRAPADGEPPP